MSKYIVELDDKDKEIFEQYINGKLGDELGDYVNVTELADAIANGTPCEPKGDCISREALKKKFDDYIKANPNISGIFELGKIIIDTAPTVPLPNEQIAWEQGYEAGLVQGKHDRLKGEWVLLETNCDDGGNNRYECSECHYSDVHASSAEVPFCWHCGAKMKGGAE